MNGDDKKWNVCVKRQFGEGAREGKKIKIFNCGFLSEFQKKLLFQVRSQFCA